MAKKKYPKNHKKSGEIDLIRYAYLTTDDRKEKNFLITKLIDVWLPYLNKKILDLEPEAKKEVLQIYRIRVLESIYKFKAKNGASFKSYLHFAAKGALDRYLAFNKKVRFEHQYAEIDSQTPQMMASVICSNIHEQPYTSTSIESSTQMYFEMDYQDRSPNCILKYF